MNYPWEKNCTVIGISMNAGCWGAVLLCALSLPLHSSLAGDAKTAIDFNRDVLPILSEHCFACHGPDAASRQADLRLDRREDAIEFGAIVPGDSSESELARRIASTDEAEIMPPPEAKKPLSDTQRDVLQRWIDEGAEYETLWSLVLPRKRPLPRTEDASNSNPIDRFVGAGLSAAGIKFSPPADRSTLLRRLYLDLIGLPPSADELAAFLADDRPDAVELVIDRLLADPHYGERMALDWLDAARYADTNGYSIDGGRHMWLWRDWVIHAFNTNMPYDQFLVEQLAGDLLPDRTDSQLLATGFQRNNMVTHEGGTIPEENLTNYNVDRVKTYGEAVLGLTLGCAQCHDHKFDPVTQRDYYRLFAYFNTVSDVGLDGDGGRNPRPTTELQTVLNGDVAGLQQEIDALTAQLQNPDAAAMATWEARQLERLQRRGADFELLPVELMKVSTPNSGDGFAVADNRVAILRPVNLAAYDVLLKLPETGQPITGLRFRFHNSTSAPGEGYGYGSWETTSDQSDGGDPRGTFILTAVSASADAVAGDQVDLNRLLSIADVTASSWLPDYRPGSILNLRRDCGWSPDLASPQLPEISVTFSDALTASETPYVTVQLNFGNGGSFVAANVEILAFTGVDDGTDLPEAIVHSLMQPACDRTDSERKDLAEYFAAHAEETRALRTDLANARESLAALTRPFSTMVMDESPQPRATHVLNRGDYAQPLEQVTPGVPEALPPLPTGATANRLGLARWTVMKENPLTARVAVNRIWKILFGTGLVATPSDFGVQGARPSHPELLDWLAVDFQEHGWNVKRLIKLIATSRTYQQSSFSSEQLLATDPRNELLGRGPRFRLPAELIRDCALKSSGLFVERIGGPSVNPYTPGDLWREVSHYGSTPATAQTFVQDHGEKLYRRSLYTYWKRTAPPPNMTAFDAPNREICTVARSSTNTPMQALVLLNDVQFVEAQRALAERICRCSEDDRRRVEWAFQESLSRSPTDEEAEVVLKLVDRERKRYRDDPEAANALLSVGESPRDETLAADELAAWSQAAAILFNLSEFVTRN